MQSTLTIYLRLGFNHIADISGYDHILFLIALCAVYRWEQWRQVLLLVTAFTLGHSLTLALAALEVVKVSTTWVEFLIPVTIVLTALYNVLVHRSTAQGQAESYRLGWNYSFAAIFGLIHGLGFSNFLRAALMPGEESQLLTQLLAFNLGVELGQLLIVAIIFALAATLLGPLRVRQAEWKLFVSGAAFGLALVMSLERWP